MPEQLQNHTGNITITDTPTDAQLAIIDAATTGTITYGSGGGGGGGGGGSDNDPITGTAAQVIETLQNKSSYTGDIPITNDYTVAQLKTINTVTTGAITLNTTNVALSGTSSDLAAAFSGTITEHTGTVTITNADYTVAQLKAINAATTGAITLTTTTNTALFSTCTAITEYTGISLSLMSVPEYLHLQTEQLQFSHRIPVISPSPILQPMPSLQRLMLPQQARSPTEVAVAEVVVV